MTNFAWIYLFSWLAVISLGTVIFYRFSKRWSHRRSGWNSTGGDDIEKDQPSSLRIWLGNRWAAQHLADIITFMRNFLHRNRGSIGTILEIILIVTWALWVGRNYLNFDPLAYPFSGDLPHQVHNHFIWNLLPKCGLCFLWNGYIDGGWPAFADLQGAALHPLVTFGSLIFGTINSTKFIILCSLVMAGLAQWWLAVEAPAGEHTYTFRYLPWDVLLGFLLTLIGTGLASYIAKTYRVSKPIGVQNETDS